MTSLLGTMGADWLLKRAFKFLLKKNLGSILQNEVSMVQPLTCSTIQLQECMGIPQAHCSHMLSSAMVAVHPVEICAFMSGMKELSFNLVTVRLPPLQVDLDMLNVSLGTGTLEVHSALLNTDYLDAQLVSTTSPFLYHLLACLLLHSAAHGGA